MDKKKLNFCGVRKFEGSQKKKREQKQRRGIQKCRTQKWDAESLPVFLSFLFVVWKTREEARDDGLGGLGKNDARRVAVVAKMSRRFWNDDGAIVEEKQDNTTTCGTKSATEKMDKMQMQRRLEQRRPRGIFVIVIFFIDRQRRTRHRKRRRRGHV